MWSKLERNSRSLNTKASNAIDTTPATRISLARAPMPVAAAKRAGRSWRGRLDAARFVATTSIHWVRHTANRPFSVMYAAMPRKAKTTSDFRFPAPMRISVLLPQPEPSVMPTPKRNPPRMYDSQVTLGRV